MRAYMHPLGGCEAQLALQGRKWAGLAESKGKKADAMVLGRVKRWLRYFSRRAKNLPVPPREERGAFDPPSAPCRSEPVGTKGVPQSIDAEDACGGRRTKGMDLEELPTGNSRQRATPDSGQSS